MNAEIITVGTELLLGDILNSNSQFLSRELAAYGIGMLYQSTVGDNIDRLGQVLSLALSRSDLVVLTGGLGPTQDDLTRETVAQTLNLPLELHEESWARIQEYFRNTGREMTDNNQKQAMLPQGAVVFPNDHGTAPGCAVERYGQCVIMLPGPPRELIPMFDDYVAPYLSKFAGGTIFSRTVGVFGLSESSVAQRLADLMCEANPTVAPYAKDGEVVLRVTAKAADQEAARALCDPVVEEIRSRLTASVYGVDAGSLQKTVVSLLKEKERKIATAESCTAGLLSSRLTEIPGASQVFECGVAAYSKEIKRDVLGVPEHLLEEHGAVSPEVACAMALGARAVGKASLGVGITGVAGPDPSEGKPVGTVYIALADEKRTWVKKIAAGHGDKDRDYIRTVATSNALDMVRRYLEALPGVMAGGELIETPAEEAPVVIPAAPPVKGKKSKLKITGIVLAILLLAAAGMLLYFYVLAPFFNKQLYERVSNMYDKNAGTSEVVSGGGIYPEGMLVQFSTLYSANSDIRGWIHIEGTGIDYPVVQSRMDGYYNNRDFYKNASSYGVPYFSGGADFTDYRYQDRSLMIYGNNTGDGQMFSDLTRYGELDYLQAHPVVEMNTLYCNAKWKVFGVMIVDARDTDVQEFDCARTVFAGEEDFLQYVQQIRDRSLFDTPTTVQEGDNLLMLTTAASSEYGFPGARIVVVARQVRQGEDVANDLSAAVRNEDAIMPPAWKGSGTGATKRTTARPSAAPGTTGASETDDATTTGAADPVTDVTEAPTTAETAAPSSGGETTKPTATTEKTTTTTLPPPPTEPSAPPPTESPTEPTTPPTDPEPVAPVPDVPDGTVSGIYAEKEYLPYFRLKFGGSRPSGLDIPEDGIFAPSTREELQMALACAVKYEMSTASFMRNSTEAVKAQAVAAYSYILNYCKGGASYGLVKSIDLSNATDKKIYDAVGEVLGVKIIDTGKSMLNGLIPTYYSAMSCGVTANTEHYWSTAQPWARSVLSKFDNEETVSKYSGMFTQTLTMSKEQFKQQVLAGFKKNIADETPGAYMDEDQFDMADGTVPFTVLEYDGVESGERRYVYRTSLTYRIGAKTYNVTGKQLRAWLVFPVSDTVSAALRSHCFEVACDGDKLSFTTYGHGHGIGMSQYGAIGLANEAGWNYIEILRHYYSITGGTNHQIVMPVWE